VYVPTAQLEQESPAKAYWPAAQPVAQALDPVEAASLPAEQSVHALAPAAE